jgi:MFS family permease
MSATEQAQSEPEQGAPHVGAAVSWDAFLSTYLPALVLALGTGIVLPAVPTLAKSYDVSFGLASGVITSYLVGSLAGTLPSGWLIDRFGSRPVMIAGPVLAALMALLVALSTNFTELLVLRFFNGVAAQMWLMARLAVISHGAAVGQRGRQVSWMFGMDHTGKMSGPVVGGFIATEWGIQAPFFAYVVLALVALVPICFYARGTASHKRAPHAKRSKRTMPLRLIVMPRIVYFGVALSAGLTRGPVQADLLHLYAAFAYQLGPQQIGYLATAASVLTWPIGFIAGWMMDRFGRKVTMVPGFIGVTLSMASLGLSAFAHLSFAWYVALFLIGVCLQSLTGGSIQTVGTDVAPAEARGTFLGLYRFTGQGGATVSPILFGLLAESLGYGYSFLFISASAAAVAYLLIRYVPETRSDG